MSQLLQNTPFWAAIIGTCSAQILKVILVFFMERRVALDRLLETGGMPSSHTAGVVALTTVIGFEEGVGSPLFAISSVFGFIVMYDATGIRRAAGIQAELINELVDELNHLFDEGFQPQVPKTLLGHTYPQVFAGLLLGIAIGTTMALL